MKKNFTSGQIQWAAQHDWYVVGNSETIIANEVYGNGASTIVSFTSFKALRDWAGY